MLSWACGFSIQHGAPLACGWWVRGAAKVLCTSTRRKCADIDCDLTEGTWGSDTVTGGAPPPSAKFRVTQRCDLLTTELVTDKPLNPQLPPSLQSFRMPTIAVDKYALFEALGQKCVHFPASAQLPALQSSDTPLTAPAQIHDPRVRGPLLRVWYRAGRGYRE